MPLMNCMMAALSLASSRWYVGICLPVAAMANSCTATPSTTGDQHAQSHGHVQGEQVAEHDGGRAGGGDDVGDLVGEKLLDALDALDDHLLRAPEVV
ncbi:MAG: hypothetical protein ACLSVD_00400 [Eggerthellaceae bacterium]